MAPTTPAMTAQEALATLRGSANSILPEYQAAVAVVTNALSDAERRATEARADSKRHFHVAAELQSRLSAVEAQCGLMREALREIAPMAKNDAMMMDSLSRHQPVPETETVEFGALADNAMLAVNRAYALIGEPEPFGPFLAYPGGKSEPTAE